MSGTIIFPPSTPMAVDENPPENMEESEKKPNENISEHPTPSEEDQLLAANILTTIRGPQTDSHLETLASAALLEISDQTNNPQPLPVPPTQKSISSKNLHDAESDGKWQTVGFFKGLSHTVTDFVDHSSWNTSMIDDINSETIPDLNLSTKTQLEPGVTYRFRLAAINSRGHGPWNEVRFLFYYSVLEYIFTIIYSLPVSKPVCLVFLELHLQSRFPSLRKEHIFPGSRHQLRLEKFSSTPYTLQSSR